MAVADHQRSDTGLEERRDHAAGRAARAEQQHARAGKFHLQILAQRSHDRVCVCVEPVVASRGTNGGTRVIHVPSAVKLRLTERVRTSRIVLREVLRSRSSATYCFSADETLPTLTERLQRSLRGSETAVRELNVPYDFLRANNAADVLAHEWLRSVAPAYYRTRGSSLIRSGAVRPASFQSGDTTNVQKTPLAPVYVTATVDPVTKQSWVHISDSEARWKLKGQAPSSMFDPDYMVVWDRIDDCLIAADLGLW